MIFSCGMLASNVQTLDLPWFHVNHWLNLVFFFYLWSATAQRVFQPTLPVLFQLALSSLLSAQEWNNTNTLLTPERIVCSINIVWREEQMCPEGKLAKFFWKSKENYFWHLCCSRIWIFRFSTAGNIIEHIFVDIFLRNSDVDIWPLNTCKLTARSVWNNSRALPLALRREIGKEIHFKIT